MKRCPSCNRTYTDPSLNFCLEDGTPLIANGEPLSDPNATIRYTTRETQAPAEIHQSQRQMATPVPDIPQRQQWSPTPAIVPPRKKSNAIWWVLGGIGVLGVISIGVVVMIIAIASMGSNSNTNTNTNRNTNANRTVNRNTNTNTDVPNVNSSVNLPSSMEDDFSQPKWGNGKFAFGDIWYKDDEYHMRSKDQTYLVMYAPNNTYNTENATVRVTARSVEGAPASTGFGLIVHGQKSKAGDLEDYVLLIYPGADPQYEIIKHKGGAQTTVVSWTKSNTIRSGSSTNQLEVRVKGPELTFYVNGQYVNRITDKDNFRRGVAGLYTSGTSEVAFDDLEIDRTN